VSVSVPWNLSLYVYTAVQNERDQIRVRRPSYEESRTARPDGITIATLHRAELLSREVMSLYTAVHLLFLDLHATDGTWPCRKSVDVVENNMLMCLLPSVVIVTGNAHRKFGEVGSCDS